MKLQRKLENGKWCDIRTESTEKFVDAVLAREPQFAPMSSRQPMTTRQQVLDYLAAGNVIRYGDDWYAEIRDADAIRQLPVMVSRQSARCDCGHVIPTTLVMNSSRGSSCPDCYDRMS